MALTTVGALALAVLFAALSRRLPADGGPYAYARAGFGNPVGFLNAWSYWITAWAGNAAIAVGWVLYVEHFINKGHTKWITVLLVLVGLWIPAAVNLSGVKNMGSVQVITTIIKFAALAFISVVGLFSIKSANFTPWNVSGESAVNAIGGGMAIALFSYLGVETAAVAAAKVRNPDRNIPGPPSWAPSPPRWSTCSRSPWPSASCPPPPWPRRTRRSPTWPTPSSAAPGPAT
jgi:APA family basic amino acid/polyamine antiporter